MMTLRQIKERLREGPYAWPGGYPVAFLCEDQEVVCFEAVRDHWRDVARAHIRRDRSDPWALACAFIHWEGPVYHCAVTGKVIPSAYGDPDEETRP